MIESPVEVQEGGPQTEGERAVEMNEAPYDATSIYRRVLVPVDFCEWSRRAILTASDMQRRFGSEVFLFTLTGFDDNDRFLSSNGAPWSTDDVVLEGRLHLEHFQREVDPTMTAACDARIGDNVVQGIEAAAERWSATLVLMGIHAPKAWRLFRSDAEKLARSLRCPLMILKTDIANPTPLRVME